MSPYLLGPDLIGWCYNNLYHLFNYYRHTIHDRSRFESELQNKESQQDLGDFRRYTIELELMIFLKFWEADYLLRQFFNLSNLSRGEEYSWEFDINLFGKRPKVIREIIQSTVSSAPNFSKLIESLYSRQLRNAIAHSKYYIIGENINLANKEEDTNYNTWNISFDDWENSFHKLLLLFNHLIGCFNKVNDEHVKKVLDKHFGLTIKRPDFNSLGLHKTQWLQYDTNSQRWHWVQS